MHAMPPRAVLVDLVSAHFITDFNPFVAYCTRHLRASNFYFTSDNKRTPLRNGLTCWTFETGSSPIGGTYICFSILA